MIESRPTQWVVEDSTTDLKVVVQEQGNGAFRIAVFGVPEIMTGPVCVPSVSTREEAFGTAEAIISALHDPLVLYTEARQLLTRTVNGLIDVLLPPIAMGGPSAPDKG